jgi:hypothetical protein
MPKHITASIYRRDQGREGLLASHCCHEAQGWWIAVKQAASYAAGKFAYVETGRMDLQRGLVFGNLFKGPGLDPIPVRIEIHQSGV